MVNVLRRVRGDLPSLPRRHGRRGLWLATLVSAMAPAIVMAGATQAQAASATTATASPAPAATPTATPTPTPSPTGTSTAGAPGPSPAAPAGIPLPPAGWTTAFADDFAGPSGTAPSSANWKYDTGAGYIFGNNEVETMTSSTSNVHLDGQGDLDITALDDNGQWTSGRIQTTTPNIQAPAGGELEVTASLEQPNAGLGYWPAFWMLGPGQWPGTGEADILEDVNSKSDMASTIHCGTYPGGPCNEPDGIGSGLQPCAGCQTGFHTYTMVLNRTNPAAESITFYLDGKQFYTVSEAQVGAATWQAAFDHSMSVIFDLAIGGNYPNAVCDCYTPSSLSKGPNAASSTSGTLSVAYVAAYETTAPVAGLTGALVGYHGLCVDDTHSKTTDLNPIQVYGCNGTNAQQWTMDPADGTIHLLGKCLDVLHSGRQDGTPLDLYHCDQTGAQDFVPQSNGTLLNPQSSKCLYAPPNASQWGTPLTLWDCASITNEEWIMP